MTLGPYDLEISGPARREMRRLPEKVAAAVASFIATDLIGSPQRVGKALGVPFEGQWSARRGSYRVLYRIDADERRVIIDSVRHPADAYRSP